MLRRQAKQLFWLGQKWRPGFCGLLNFVCVRGKWGKTTFLSFFAQVTCFSCAVPSTSFVLTSSWLCRRPQTDLNSSMYQFRFSLYLNGHKDKSTVFDLTNLHSEYLLKHLLANSLSWCLFCCFCKVYPWSILSNWWFSNIYLCCFS